ncbi:hypothetical protein JTP94_24750 [Rhizobium lusitanum]|nr:hypothetical protein [Rhizobium lusitanum]
MRDEWCGHWLSFLLLMQTCVWCNALQNSVLGGALALPNGRHGCRWRCQGGVNRTPNKGRSAWTRLVTVEPHARDALVNLVNLIERQRNANGLNVAHVKISNSFVK